MVYGDDCVAILTRADAVASCDTDSEANNK